MNRHILLFVILMAVMQSVSAQFQKPTIDPAIAKSKKLDIHPVRSEITRVNLLKEVNNPTEPDGLINTLPGITPNQEFEEIDEEILRKTEEKIRNLKSNYPDVELNRSPMATNPSIGNDFQANVYDGWRPPDNNLAISNAGDIVTCTNSHIYYYNSSGMLLYSASYGTFFGNSTHILYDPKVLFDPVSNRFIMVVLQGNTPSFTQVLLCYSKSNDPSDGWWVYSLDGDVGGNNNWFDYPNIAISNNEVFITGNLFNSSDNFQYAVVYQVDKVNGYNGNTITHVSWSNLYSDPFTLVPVSYGQSGSYGPGIYMISTDENGTGTDYYRLYEIDNDLSNSPICHAYAVSGSFTTTGNAPQSGTTTLLDNGGTRIRSGFYLNGIVHFVLTDEFNSTGYNALQYNRLTVSSLTNTSYNFGLDGYDYSYPAVASYGTSSTDKTVIIGFLRSSSTIYPEFRVVECDDAGTWSGSVQVKAGETYISVAPDAGVERWGDYTGIVRKDSGTPEIWVAGCYGEAVTVGGHKYGSWVAQITDCTRPAKPLTISGSTPACRSQVNTYSIAPVAGATSYTWTLPTGWSGSSTTTSINVTPGTLSGTIYVYANNACGAGMAQSMAVSSVATPTITSVTPDVSCGAGILTLGATASAGTINWYDFSSGGASLGTGTSYTTPLLIFSNTYYVDATYSGCTTDSRTAVAATVYTRPSISGTTPASRCGTGTVTLGATASAGTINWYAAPTGGLSLGTGTSYTTPSISTSTTYYVDATANGCTTSSRTAVTATVNSIPTISGTTPASRCGAGSVTLGATASAGTVNWYAASIGGTPLATGNTYPTPSLTATTTYYVDATNNGCTTAARTAVTATINAIPSILSTTPGSRCGTGSVTLGATASAGTINWYSSPSGGSSLGTGTSFATPSITLTTTYFVDATANGCTTAARTAVTATVTPLPTITGITPGSRCGIGNVTLGATSSSGTVNWYAAASGGTSLGTGTSFTTPLISVTTTYYAEAITVNGCTSLSRTAVTATVNNAPAMPDPISGPSPVCEGSTNTYSIAVVPGATSYTWTLPGGWSGSSVTTSINVVAGTVAGSISVTANNACGAGSVRIKGIAVTNVPVMLSLQNYNVLSGQNLCFNTSQTIVIAGSGSIFYVQPGGSTILTAGLQINYYPGALVYQGGYMHGYIATGVCCGLTPLAPAITSETGYDNSEVTSVPIMVDSYFKVYPNPTSGSFILEMAGDPVPGNVNVDVFGIRGEKIETAVISSERKHEFSLSNRPPGIYYIRVISGNKATTAKIIKE